MKSALISLVTGTTVLCALQGCKPKEVKERFFVSDPMPKYWPNARAGSDEDEPINPALVKDRLFGSWVAEQDRSLKRQWQSHPFSRKVVCKMTVSKYGQLLNVELAKSCKVKSDDEAAIAIIRAAAPFETLPQIADQQTFLVEFLDYPTVFVSRIKQANEPQ